MLNPAALPGKGGAAAYGRSPADTEHVAGETGKGGIWKGLEREAKEKSPHPVGIGKAPAVRP